MSSYEIIPCTLAHLRTLARTMRAADRAEITNLGLVPRHLLIALWRRSIEPKTVLVEGLVAACWGDAGAMLSDDGEMWLFTAPPIERIPQAFLREARREVGELLAQRVRLVADASADYTRALRFFGMVGFQVEPSTLPAYRRLVVVR